MITIKVTNKDILIAVWDGLKLIKFKKYGNEYAKKITLVTMKLKQSMNDIIYFDSTGEFDKYFSGALKIKPDRQPIKRENYKNLKHQLYFYLIKSINNNTLSIECEFPNNELKQELQHVKQNKYSESNKLEIISRKQIVESLGRDINLVDLLSYRFFAILKGMGKN